MQAYAILSDPDTRMEYNRQLEQALADEDDSFTGAAAVAELGLPLSVAAHFQSQLHILVLHVS